MSFTDSSGLIDRLLTKASYPSAILYTFLNSVLWFLGIHGANVLQPLMLHLNEISAATGGFVNESFLGAFVFIGGSGATFSLILAIAFFSKNKTLRLLSYASVPIALMNINELLVFGLPIILNPRMFVPFLIVPLVNVLVAFGAIYLGWVSPPDAQVPFNALVGLNAYLATHHDIHAVFLQIFNVSIGTLIYSRFVQKMDNGSRDSSNIYIKSLDMTYTHINEEASLFSYDPISSANQLRRRSAKQKQHMEYLAQLEFYLEYQPQVVPHSHQFVGSEALLRAKDARGEVVMPYVFLPWLEAAGMMKNIDLWVAGAAVKQDKLWQAAGIVAPIKINVSGDTLADKKSADVLVEKVSKANGRISIEIVEQDFSAGMENAKAVIAKIQRFGAKVYIDDFGTGYSSLSYLNSLNADAIKIDRSFVLGLNQPEGEKVMAGIFNFAEALGLEVVVEGVETEEQLAKIPQNMPFAVQGWLYSKALDADEIPSFMQRYPIIH
jgi:EAL domain-containing protein (putative c-di-GMP-specific phosphodiesterase class I)